MAKRKKRVRRAKRRSTTKRKSTRLKGRLVCPKRFKGKKVRRRSGHKGCWIKRKDGTFRMIKKVRRKVRRKRK